MTAQIALALDHMHALHLACLRGEVPLPQRPRGRHKMPALNFMKRLADLVEDGRKRQTVRRERKRPIRPGDRLVMYTGQRTTRARKLMETTCSRVENFYMDEHGRIILGYREPIEDARILGPEEAEAFAQADGLGVDGSTAYDDLHSFLLANYGLPFEGVVIYW